MPADPATLRFDRLADDVDALRAHLGLETADVLGPLGRLPRRAGLGVRRTPSGCARWCSSRRRAGCRAATAATSPAIRAAFADQPWYADAAEAQRALEDGAPPAQQQALVRATRPFFYGRWDERTQAHAATADRQSSKRAELGLRRRGVEDLDVPALLAGLQQVTAPVLVVGGGPRRADRRRGGAAVVAAVFPAAELVVLPRGGPLPVGRRPGRVPGAVADWLRGRTADPDPLTVCRRARS